LSGYIQNLKSNYGKLLEKYFIELVFRVLGKENFGQQEEPEKPDIILIFNSYVLLFKFATKYYQIFPLYNSELEHFYNDLDKILLNAGKPKEKMRQANFKLNNYVENKLKTHPDHKIIPTLVIEKNLERAGNFFGLIHNMTVFTLFLISAIQCILHGVASLA